MVRSLVGAVLVLLMVATVAVAQENKDTGKIKKVNVKDSTILVTVKNLDLEYLTTDETKFFGADKKPLTDGLKNPYFKAGATVTITYKGETRIAREVWCGEKK